MRETTKRAKAALKCFRLWKCRLGIIGLDLDALEVERENADREHAGEAKKVFEKWRRQRAPTFSRENAKINQRG